MPLYTYVLTYIYIYTYIYACMRMRGPNDLPPEIFAKILRTRRWVCALQYVGADCLFRPPDCGVSVSVCIHVDDVGVYVCVCSCVYVNVCMICTTRTFTHQYKHTHTHICISFVLYVYRCECMYVYTYTHAWYTQQVPWHIKTYMNDLFCMHVAHVYETHSTYTAQVLHEYSPHLSRACSTDQIYI